MRNHERQFDGYRTSVTYLFVSDFTVKQRALINYGKKTLQNIYEPDRVYLENIFGIFHVCVETRLFRIYKPRRIGY